MRKDKMPPDGSIETVNEAEDLKKTGMDHVNKI